MSHITFRFDVAVEEIKILDTTILHRNLENRFIYDRLGKLYISNAVTLLFLIPLLFAYFH